MNSIDEIIFTSQLPKLDLHGYDRDTARVEIIDFILENVKLGNKFVMIIHGIGQGIIHQVCIDVLKKQKFVKDFRLDYFNTGCTIVMLQDYNKKSVDK